MKKGISLLLVIAMLAASICSCSDNKVENDSSDANKNNQVNDPAQSETEPEEVDRFADVNYGGKSFRIYTSVDTTDATNSDQFIRGSGELTGEIVNDAVFNRNAKVSEKLNIKLEFEEANYNYDSVKVSLNNIILSGIDAYDIMANDMRAFASLSATGSLHNIYGNEILDLDKSYWNKNAMDDLMFIDGGMFCLVGDYFTDALASCHVLYVNESMLEDNIGDKEYINKLVFDGNWTFDEMISIISTATVDSDGDGEMKEGDVFGFTCIGTWGSMIPFLIGTDIQFIEKDSDGNVSYVFNNERSVKILEKLNELFYSDGSLINLADYSSAGLRNVFSNNKTLIMGYNRLGDLANLRDIDFSMGVVPYPKLDTAQENYVASMHDITEIGAIPVTVQLENLDFVLTCLEVLSIETSRMVIPEYYENALKVKYVAGEDDAKMIDLIHDSVGSPFAVAYDNALGSFMLSTCFSQPLGNKQTDFASAYKKNEKASKKLLEKLTGNFVDVLFQSGN